jgi:hypothetical protein
LSATYVNEDGWRVRIESRQDVLDAAGDVDAWLKLPVARKGGGCPNCGEPHFGAINAFAFLLIYRCHGNELTGAPSCGTLYRGRHGHHHDWKREAAEIFGAFIGYRRRFIVGKA